MAQGHGTNRTRETARVRARVQQGFPNGVDEESAIDLKVLLMRIDELEAALAPFARIAQIPSTAELVPCYFAHCQKALSAMAQDTGPQAMKEFYYPA
jgi:hypothetical protein